MLSAQDGPEFFSLSDNSASHAQECNFWSATEKLPWSEGAAKKWYKQYPDLYADDVLELAASKGAFTLTTAKTWYASSTRVRDLLTIIVGVCSLVSMLYSADKPRVQVISSSQT